MKNKLVSLNVVWYIFCNGKWHSNVRIKIVEMVHNNVKVKYLPYPFNEKFLHIGYKICRKMSKLFENERNVESLINFAYNKKYAIG